MVLSRPSVSVTSWIVRLGRELAQRRAETDLALLLAAEDAAAQRDQHAARLGAGPLGHEVRRRGASRAVVDADVGDPAAER